jgi:hypothetical protein
MMRRSNWTSIVPNGDDQTVYLAADACRASLLPARTSNALPTSY